jgi:hypothetical protein
MRANQLILVLGSVLSLAMAFAVGQQTAANIPGPAPDTASNFRGIVQIAPGAPKLEKLTFRGVPGGDRRPAELIRLTPDQDGRFVSGSPLPARFTIETTPPCLEISRLLLDVPGKDQQDALDLGVKIDLQQKTIALDNTLSVTNLETLTRIKDTFGGINLGCPSRKRPKGGTVR